MHQQTSSCLPLSLQVSLASPLLQATNMCNTCKRWFRIALNSIEPRTFFANYKLRCWLLCTCSSIRLFLFLFIPCLSSSCEIIEDRTMWFVVAYSGHSKSENNYCLICKWQWIVTWWFLDIDFLELCSTTLFPTFGLTVYENNDLPAGIAFCGMIYGFNEFHLPNIQLKKYPRVTKILQ